jgi:hypothetical protein
MRLFEHQKRDSLPSAEHNIFFCRAASESAEIYFLRKIYSVELDYIEGPGGSIKASEKRPNGVREI